MSAAPDSVGFPAHGARPRPTGRPRAAARRPDVRRPRGAAGADAGRGAKPRARRAVRARRRRPGSQRGLSDYLLGQADPIGRADAVRHLRQDPPTTSSRSGSPSGWQGWPRPRTCPSSQPAPGGGSFLSRGAAPARGAEEPTAPSRSPLAAIPQGAAAASTPRLRAPAVILIAVVLAVTGVFSGDDEPASADDTTTSAEGTSNPAQTGEIPDGQELTSIPLRATGNGDARGAATIGLSTGDQPYIDLVIQNLDQEPRRPGLRGLVHVRRGHGLPAVPDLPRGGRVQRPLRRPGSGDRPDLQPADRRRVDRGRAPPTPRRRCSRSSRPPRTRPTGSSARARPCSRGGSRTSQLPARAPSRAAKPPAGACRGSRPRRIEPVLQRSQSIQPHVPNLRRHVRRMVATTAWWWVIVPPVATIASHAAVFTARHCSISAPTLRGPRT